MVTWPWGRLNGLPLIVRAFLYWPSSLPRGHLTPTSFRPESPPSSLPFPPSVSRL